MTPAAVLGPTSRPPTVAERIARHPPTLARGASSEPGWISSPSNDPRPLRGAPVPTLAIKVGASRRAVGRSGDLLLQRRQPCAVQPPDLLQVPRRQACLDRRGQFGGHTP